MSQLAAKASLLESSVQRLRRWVEGNGWAGHDPYDLAGHPLVARLERSRQWPLRAARRLVRKAARACPRGTRRALGVRKAINPKAMGLFAAAYTTLGQATGDRTSLATARECADWLLGHANTEHRGLCWGYPFDWQSIVFIPRGTPSSVVSATVGDGLWRLAEATGDPELWGACASICEFFVHGLNRDEIDTATVCFSYTPADGFHVHNANLLAAEFLARVGSRMGLPHYVDLAVRAGNYALREQRRDGSLNYWGGSQDSHAPGHRDCYHSGFEARALWGLWHATGDVRFRDAAEGLLGFFHRAYIRDDGSVWTRLDRQFPVDIHACAEALLCPAALREAANARFEHTWPDVLHWVVGHMQNRDGSFAYRRYADGSIDRTPYLRWGQAWMFRALTELLHVTEGDRA